MSLNNLKNFKNAITDKYLNGRAEFEKELDRAGLEEQMKAQAEDNLVDEKIAEEQENKLRTDWAQENAPTEDEQI